MMTDRCLGNSGSPSVGQLSSRLVRLGRNRRLIVAIWLSFLFYCAYHVCKLRIWRLWPDIMGHQGDHSIIFEYSYRIIETGSYPDNIFPYPPSAALLFYILGSAGALSFSVLWLGLMFAGLVISMRASLGGEGADVQTAWLIIGAIGLLISTHPVSWDLRNTNSNLICLGLVMSAYAILGRRPVLAGVVIAVSASLKLYSGLLFVWLLWRGPRAALGAGILAAVVLWVAAPILLFGLKGAANLYFEWYGQMRRISDPLLVTPAPLVTLRGAAANLANAGPTATSTVLVLGLSWAIWISALLWYAWRALPHPALKIPSRAALADWTILLLAPLPFSPWLEPYHAVPILPGAILCIVSALDRTSKPEDRRIAAAAVVLLALTFAFMLPWPLRGLTLLASFLVLTVAIGLMRPRLAVSRS